MHSRIGLILPYFGTLPNYFNLWLKTAKSNAGFADYLIFSDCDFTNYIIPNNVKIIKLSINDLEKKINDIMPFKCKLFSAYKLCDYRPLYGAIFKDYLSNYEFWGHCDPDIIWGNISHFIDEQVLANYDRILSHGHLCIYRNNEIINNAVINDFLYYGELKRSGITIKDVFKHKYAAHFDEGEAIKKVFLQNKVSARLYDSTCFADIYTGKKEFECIDFIKNENKKVVYFIWENGTLFGVDINDAKKEYAYLHLQKRSMTNNLDDLYEKNNMFIVIPNSFINYHKVSADEKESWSKSDDGYEKNYKKWCNKSKIKHIFEGALIFRIKYGIAKIRLNFKSGG